MSEEKKRQSSPEDDFQKYLEWWKPAEEDCLEWHPPLVQPERIPRDCPILRQKESGPIIHEASIRLAGFGGGLLPRNDFDEAMLKAVNDFETLVMKRTATGSIDYGFAKALDQFATTYPFELAQLQCGCGKCGGFGDAVKYPRGKYRKKGSSDEGYHEYEYPGVHRSLLWAVKSIRFFCEMDHPNEIRFLLISDGYRCHRQSKSMGSSTTNHQGKAMDMHFETFVKGKWQRARLGSEAKYKTCNTVRSMIEKRMSAGIGWSKSDHYSLEKGGWKKENGEASTWVHFDVRKWPNSALADEYFSKTIEGVEGAKFVDILSGHVKLGEG